MMCKLDKRQWRLFGYLNQQYIIGPIEICPFNLPSIRFTAETNADMIDLETSRITEPPFTKYLSYEVLIIIVRTPIEIPCSFN